MRTQLFVGVVFIAVLGTPACDGDDGADPAPRVALTDEVTLVPVQARLSPPEARNPSVPADREAMLVDGLGDVSVGEGEPHVARVLGGGTAPSPSDDAALVARIIHFADAQLTDDESPSRLALADRPGLTSSAYRPQDAYLCHLVDAMVGTFTALHAERPVDLVLVGGDNIDNAQQNELDWWLTLMGPGGGTLSCDSGADDDPVPGPGNDPKDPIDVGGLGALPWLWVTGNHDLLVQGNFVPNERSNGQAIGDEPIGGTRDWREPGGPVVTTSVPADPARALLSGVDLLTRVAADGDGHGISAAVAATGQAFYAADVAGTDLRIVVLDTASPTGGASGLLRQADIDRFATPLLDQALTDGRRVILAAHHAAVSLTDGGSIGGTAQDDALTTEDFVAWVTGYPNVVLSLVAHSHEHRVTELVGPDGASVFEVLTAALSDYPHQSRLVELYDEGADWLRVRLTSIDVDTTDAPLAAEGYRLGVLDWVAGWAYANTSDPDDRNVDLWIPAAR